ncbi:hypothetical protein F5I97DRAFT_1784347, partial [Phlebopus sp. FC_14]
IFLSPPKKISYHTSILISERWILELMNGHSDHIKISLGVSHEVFYALVYVLKENGFACFQHEISVEQQLEIFLY